MVKLAEFKQLTKDIKQSKALQQQRRLINAQMEDDEKLDASTQLAMQLSLEEITSQLQLLSDAFYTRNVVGRHYTIKDQQERDDSRIAAQMASDMEQGDRPFTSDRKLAEEIDEIMHANEDHDSDALVQHLLEVQPEADHGAAEAQSGSNATELKSKEESEHMQAQDFQEHAVVATCTMCGNAGLVLQLACGHHSCHGCLGRLFKTVLEDMSLSPASCCKVAMVMIMIMVRVC